jgi:hypothetical protein
MVTFVLDITWLKCWFHAFSLLCSVLPAEITTNQRSRQVKKEYFRGYGENNYRQESKKGTIIAY